MNPPRSEFSRLPGLALALLAGALVYAQAPWSGLFWDDHFVVRDQVAHFDSLRHVLLPPADTPGLSPYYYRPLVWLTQALDLWLFGAGASGGPHLLNLALHLGVVAGLWLLARHLLRARLSGTPAATLAALVFAVHPIHTESVLWLSGRSDLLATLFLLPAVHCALLWRDRRAWPALLALPLLFLAALLGKEVAIVGFVVIPAALLLTGEGGGMRQRLQASAAPVAVMMLAGGVYLWLRALWGTSHRDLLPDLAPGLWQEPLRALAWYARKLIVPWPQSVFVAGDLLPGLLATLATLALIAVGAAAALRLARWRGEGLPALGILWFGAALAPALLTAILPIFETPVAERYLYLPSAGAALVVADLYCRAARHGHARWAGIALLAVGALFAASTVARGVLWRSEQWLWEDASAKVSTHGFPLNMLGIAHGQRGDEEQALQAFLRARGLQNRPLGQAHIELNIGKVYRNRRALERARQHFSAAVAADPGSALAHTLLGDIHVQLAAATASGERRVLLDAAVASLVAAVALDPRLIEARIGLGRALAARAEAENDAGEQGAAIASLREAMAVLDVGLDLAGSDADRATVIVTQRKVRAALRRLSAGAVLPSGS